MPELVTNSAALADTNPSWHVLWTRSNCEQSVHDQLIAKGFEVFLPKVGAWSRRAGRRYVARVPMFAGYLFVHHTMDKTSYITICKSKANGLVMILGERWDRLEVVPNPEIQAIQLALRSSVPVFPHPYLREGQRVRVVRGPLADVEGILVRDDRNRGLLVISINMLHRSVAVQIDCTLVAAA